MSASSTQYKMIVTVAGSYAAAALNVVTSYVSLSVLGPQMIGLYQTFVLIKNYTLYSNLGEVESIRKQGAVLWARSEHAEFSRYQDQALTVAIGTIVVVVVTVGVVGMTLLRPIGLQRLTFAAILILFAIEYLQYFFGNCLVARNEFELRTRGAVLLAVVSLVSLLLILPFGYIGFLLSKMIAGVVFLLYLLRVLKYRLRLARHITEFRTMVKTGLPMSVIGFLSTYFVTADRLVVVRRLDTFNMGVYSIVPMIVLPLMLFVQGASTVLFTRSSHLLGARAHPKDIVEDVASFTRSTDRFVPHLVGILIFLLPVFVSRLLPRYEAGILAAQIALVGYCFYGIASAFANLFIVLDRPQLFVAILLASGSATLMLGNLAVAAGWGLSGIAAGGALGSFMYAVATMYFPLRWAGYGRLDGVGFLVRQIRNTFGLTAVAAVALLIVQASGARWVLVSTIIAITLAIGSARTLLSAARRTVQYFRAPNLRATKTLSDRGATGVRPVPTPDQTDRLR